MVQLCFVICLFGVACVLLWFVRGFVVCVVLVHFGCGVVWVLVLVFCFNSFVRCLFCCAGCCSTPSFVVLWFILVTVVPGFTRRFFFFWFFGVVGSCCFFLFRGFMILVCAGSGFS